MTKILVLRKFPPRSRKLALLTVLVILDLSAITMLSLQVHAQGSTIRIGPWTEQIDNGAPSGSSESGGIHVQGNSCVTYSAYVYCVGGQDFATGNPISDVFYAQ